MVFKKDIQILKEHSNKFRAQYRRISEVKSLVMEQTNKTSFIRVDWSESVSLFQTRQEKSDYYTTTSCSINAAVFYTSDGVKGLGTISDVKAHTASPTWASLSEMFELVDISDIIHL